MPLKENKDITCRRCGSCCKVDMVAYVTSEDIQRWEEEGRNDILSRIRNNGVTWAGDRIVNKSGRILKTCYYLSCDGSTFSCEIYETRPLVCRNFVPGSSYLCTQYRQGQNGTSIK